MKFRFFCFLALCLGFSAPASAGVVYNYVGNLSDATYGDMTACLGVCRLTGSFTVASPLAPNLPYLTDAQPTSFFFTNGVVSFDSSVYPITPTSIRVSTDSAGNITDWYFLLPGDYYLLSCSACNQDYVGHYDPSLVGYEYSFSRGSLTIAAIPEASTWAMLILGFAGVGFTAYRRRNRSTLNAA